MYAKKHEIVVIAGQGNTRKTGIAVISMIDKIMKSPRVNEGPLNRGVIVSTETDAATMLNYMVVLGGFTDTQAMEYAFRQHNYAVDVLYPASLEMDWMLERLEGYVDDQIGGTLDILIDGIDSFIDFGDSEKERLAEIGKEVNGNLFITAYASRKFNFGRIEADRMEVSVTHRHKLRDLADIVLVTPAKSSEMVARIYDHKDVNQIGREFTFRPSGITENSDELKALNNPGYEWLQGPLLG